jgi:hypothetical protein
MLQKRMHKRMENKFEMRCSKLILNLNSILFEDPFFIFAILENMAAPGDDNFILFL